VTTGVGLIVVDGATTLVGWGWDYYFLISAGATGFSTGFD